MPKEKKGIAETKDLVMEAISLGNSIGNAMQDNKINLADLGYFLDPLMKLPAALRGIEEVPAELSDLDDAEREELIEAVKDTFDLPDDKVETAIEEGLLLAAQIHSYVKNVILE